MNLWHQRHGRLAAAWAPIAAAFAIGTMLAAGMASAVNKDPPKTKVGPPRETHGAPPCVPQQDYTGNYVCTDPSGTRWNCTIESNGWHCTEATDQPPKEPIQPKQPKKP